MKKSIIISGGSQGIGKALVKKFLENGFQVFTCARNAEKLESLKRELKHPLLHTFVADLSDKKQVSNFAQWILNQETKIDVLINNAGYFLPGQIQNEEDGVLERQIEANLYSAYHLTKAILPGMQKSKSGHILVS